MSSPSSSLSTLKVSVRRARTPLLRLELIRVHSETHRAPSLSPVPTSLLEDDVETLSLSLLLDETGSRDDHGVDVRRDGRAGRKGKDDGGGSSEILDSGVGAGSEEGFVDLDGVDGDVGGETHVLEGTLHAGLLDWVGDVGRVGNGAGDGDDVLGRGSPGDGGDDVGCLDVDLDVVVRPLVRSQRPPVSLRRRPLLSSLGRQRSTLEVLERDLVRSDHPRPSPSLDRHVADRHPRLHAQRSDGRTAKLDDATGSSGRSDDADDVEDNVFGGDAWGELAFDSDSHVAGLVLHEGLGGKDVLDLRGSDSEGKGTERSVCRGVGV